MPTIADLFAGARSRWRLILIIMVATLALVGAWTLITPRSYVAQASLLFEGTPAQAVTDTAQPQDTVAALVATQADVLQSAAIAADVVRDLNLASDPSMIARWRETTGGTGDINAWYGRQLLSLLTVSPGRSSRVLAIQVRSTDPAFSAQIANGFAGSFLKARLRQQTDPARTYSRWFEERTREVRTALEQAQARLTAFQRQTGIVDTTPNNADTARLAELSGQLTAAEAAAADVGARAGQRAAASPDVQSSAVVQGLRSQISVKAAELAQLSADLGPNHPDRRAAEAELSALRQRLATEVATSTTAVRVASGAARGKEGELRSLLNQQRGQMLARASDRAELDVLQRDVDSARAAYDAVTQRLGTMRLQSEAPTTNVMQLDVAQPPLLPSSPNIPLRLLLGLLLGGLLALGVAITLEIWKPRVRTDDGATASLDVPVIGSVSFARSGIYRILRERQAA